MEKLDKHSPEYISNGHYKIDGIDFMSVWTYKNKKGIEPNNTTSNSSAGLYLHATCESIPTKPDFGNFDVIYIFKKEDLDKYFNR